MKRIIGFLLLVIFNGAFCYTQQPFEISVISSSEDNDGIKFDLSVYPNPTHTFLIVTVGNFISDNLSYQLYDVNGKLLENEKLIDAETSINMVMLLPSVYFLRVSYDNTAVKTFKIAKY
jgi:hypothetical protein